MEVNKIYYTSTPINYFKYDHPNSLSMLQLSRFLDGNFCINLSHIFNTYSYFYSVATTFHILFCIYWVIKRIDHLMRDHNRQSKCKCGLQ